ncbi:ubiquitin-like protein ATG12 [Eremomyces bilateralis CBS 781.70]|uniref:Ubiquitin-like protein ATG12 n=1 Tax=Eremomyces bilateralis CBS 781.70 TaxID=1392243 RepID=A0A6G1G645_9PEZI|nr:ubiquitin-like protein ATG12 [Eremomyces bilateralis CBS 781.70]KAF1813421.1 ubiquitin-like protein ATG12 [Eremomyces bilateralis CBS 781.70]
MATPAPPVPPGYDPSTPPSDEEKEAEMPLTMAASVVLDALPRDAAAALEGAVDTTLEKVTVRLQPVGSAPILRQRVFKIAASKKFETVIRSLRKKLSLKESESVFCYVNSVFSPSPEEGVGNLWNCFKVKDELVVCYSVAPAFG